MHAWGQCTSGSLTSMAPGPPGPGSSSAWLWGPAPLHSATAHHRGAAPPSPDAPVTLGPCLDRLVPPSLPPSFPTPPHPLTLPSLQLADFGLSHVAPGPIATNTWGTLRYMAPEHFQGTMSRATDVFAFGMLLWEMVTGKKPYENMTQGEPPPPRSAGAAAARAFKHARVRLQSRSKDGRAAQSLKRGRGGVGWVLHHGGVHHCAALLHSAVAHPPPYACVHMCCCLHRLPALLMLQPVAHPTPPRSHPHPTTHPTPGEVIQSVSQGLRPQWPPDCFPHLEYLGKRCIAHNPADRPTFSEIVKELEDMEVMLRELLQVGGCGGWGACGRGRRASLRALRLPAVWFGHQLL